MATVQANGIDFHVSRFRSGPPGDRPIIVCVHGLGVVDQSSMSMSLGLYLALHFDVVLYDLRAHGRSGFVTSGFTLAQHAEDFVALLDALAIDRPVHVLGGSYGGAVGIRLAVDHPDRVASLALIDPLIPVPDWSEQVALSLEYAQRRMYEAGNSIEELMVVLQINARRRAVGLAERGRRLLEETTLVADLRSEPGLTPEQFGSIKAPAMAVFGMESLQLPLVSKLPELIPGVEIVSVEGATHVGVFGRPETRESVARFVHRIEPISAAPPAGV